jgi:hypothetical protein
MGDLLQFSLESERTTGYERLSKRATVLAPKISGSPEDSPATSGRISIDDLYPGLGASETLSRSLSLLAQAQERINEANEQIKLQNPVAADDAMQRLQAFLPELFCCRTLGDGFGAIINAVLLGLQNSEGQPLNERQIEVIGRALRTVRNEPFLSFESALQVIEKLNEADLRTNPQAFPYLADWLSDDEPTDKQQQQGLRRHDDSH